ncbi:acetyl-CoA carboxylase biotin carboxylase subunit [Fundicoccus culcitae]|uniref:Biotin carboxylase n=1 Tax=Fundicoccus culcitae TaxID=2969821 RepID=A0ABY5P6A6_9LACT|nr:acetyl-CoA carboxylase biotin carboxylase subunit [Fundicoccus culcitae]UUX34269.1 acetyl-CoA carboxylase biotin carboxylase subunit [Fundicoccus culcitae]
MFKKVLVANRGEIAVRIIRALREMGITSVAIYSKADENALHTELADEAICIGPAKGLDSYANPIAVLSAAMVMGCDAIHPGYGFLSERSDFVQMCEETGIKFIGPSSEIIHLMGNKQNARTTMQAAGVPITPGSKGLVHSLDEAHIIAQQIGFPLIIKAADGGGGKGMRRVEEMSQFDHLFEQAQNETQAIYGNKDLYIERIIYPARHIEVQILADEHGNVIHLGERDCSLQRNNQKVIEFAPAQSLSEETRAKICQTAVQAAKAIGYTNAGTIEFLLDENENFYFMEMNTRLQVEHPVTEMITGIDIVKQQILIASNQPLEYTQEMIHFNGFAIECRLNAEDPKFQFRPSSGYINRLILPSGGIGLRVESAVYPQYLLPPFYDSMIAKIIVHQPTREAAFKLMDRALYEVVVEGLETNIELLDGLISSESVFHDRIHTKWLEESFMPEWQMTLHENEDTDKLEEA